MFTPILVLYLQSQDNPASGFPCLIIVVIAIIALVVSANNRKKALAKAKASYQAALSKLKSDPTNADLRQRTLGLGRVYSNLTRRRRGVTVFDEVALMNDINAACAGATSVPRKMEPPAEAASIENRLAKLSDLRSKGLINEQEYVSRRQKIIDEI